MSSLEKHFKADYIRARSNPKAIVQGPKFRITVLSEQLIRLEYDENSIFEDRPTELALYRDFDLPQFKLEEDTKFVVINTKYFSLQYLKGKPFVGPKYAPEANLKINLVGTDRVWCFNHPEIRNYNSMVANLDNTENHYDKNANKISAEKVKKRIEEVFVKQKGLYSGDGFVSLDDSASLVMDEDGGFFKKDHKSIDTYVFFYKDDFQLCLKNYFRLTGEAPLIPRYALGVWWNRNKLYTQDDIKNLVNEFAKNQIPLSVLLLGDTWHLKDKSNLNRFKTGYTFNPDYYSSPAGLTKFLHEKGIRFGLNIDPGEGIYPFEPHYDEIAAYLNMTEKQTIPFNVFDKNLMYLYLNKLILPLSNIGVDFFWIDYYNDQDKFTNKLLNYYHFNDYKKFPSQRPLLLSRISDVAPHRYPVHYSGETLVSWKTLATLPAYNASASNLGVSWWSHDVGGYKDGVEDAELYVRNVQLGTYSPIFRFASKYGRYYKREPWRWDVKTSSIVQDYCTMRHRLVPYLYSAAYQYYKNGKPLIQPLYYKYPAIYDEPLFKNEYYFGTELFIAPITSPKDNVMNRAVERIFIPEGTWFDFKRGKKFPGNKRYVMFFKDEDYPVFAQSGSIIPLADLSQNINLLTPPKTMEIHVFPGRSNSFDLYEDDGVTALYKEGYYILTKIEYNYMLNNYTLIIRPLEGKSGLIPDYRNYRIRFRNTRQASDIIAYVGQEKIACEHYVEESDFIVEIADVSTTQQLTINCKGRNIEIDAVPIINEDIDAIISDLQIKTALKEKIAYIIFGDLPISKKRIEIKKLKKVGLEPLFIRMFIKLLEYIAEI